MHKTSIFHFSGKIPLNGLNNYQLAYSCILLIQGAEVATRDVLEVSIKSVQRCSNSQENTVSESPFSIELQACNSVEKATPTQVFFYEFCIIFQSAFYRIIEI